MTRGRPHVQGRDADRRTPGVLLGLALGTWATGASAGAVLLHLYASQASLDSLDGLGYAWMLAMTAGSAFVCGLATAVSTAAYLLVKGPSGLSARSWLVLLPAIAAPVGLYLFLALA